MNHQRIKVEYLLKKVILVANDNEECFFFVVKHSILRLETAACSAVDVVDDTFAIRGGW